MSIRRHTLLLSILLVAVCARLVLFFVLSADGHPDNFLLGDSHGYVQIANNMLAGDGFSLSTTTPFLPDSVRVPLLPLLLAGAIKLSGSATSYVLLQIALATGLVFLTYRLCLVVTENEPLALAAGALMAFEPYSVFINFSVLTETLFAFLITAASYAAALYVRNRSWRSLAVASAFFGLAALTRPIAQFMPTLLIVLVFFRESPRAYLKYIAAATIPFLLVASPWIVRNYETFGKASLSSGGFQNVYSDLGATILVYKNGEGSVWKEQKNALESDFASRHNIPVSTIQQNLELSPALFNEGLSLMIQNPGSTAKSFLSVAIAFLTNDAWSYYLQHWGWMQPFSYGFSPTQSLISAGPFVTFERIMASGGAGLIVAFVGRIFWVLITLLFCTGLWLLSREKGKKRIYAISIAITVLYYLGLSWSTGAGVNGRYRYPVNPLIFSVACVGAAYIASRIKSMVGWRKES